jgi:hypothetical protein
MMKFSRVLLALALLLAPAFVSNGGMSLAQQAGPGAHVPGPRGAAGPQGVQGIAGSKIYNDVVAPSPTLGTNGDYFINRTTGDLSTKISGAWSVVANIIGPTGATGPVGSAVRNGAGAPSSGLGSNGDFYIDTTAKALYGPKTTGVWGSSTSLIGPTGSTGAVGSTGATGATGAAGINAYTTTSASFTMPAAGSTVPVSVAATSWMVAGQTLYVGTAGFMTVSSITSSVAVVLNNAGIASNASTGATIASGVGVAPGGAAGAGSVASGTTGQIAGYSGTGTGIAPITALPNGTTGTTQLATDNTTKVATTAQVQLAAAASHRSYLAGLTLSTAGSSSSFGIAAGLAVDSASVSTMNLSSAYTKTTSSWAVGSGNGSLDTGTIAASTWYHAYLIQRTDTGIVEVLASLSASAPSLPTNYSLSRRLGSMKTDGSSKWIAFIQNGDHFRWVSPVNDATSVVAGVTTRISKTITVPTGLVLDVELLFQVIGGGSGATGVITSLDETATTINQGFLDSSAGAGAYGSTVRIGGVHTSTSAQIGVNLNTTDSGYTLNTLGWIDRRGRDL